MKLKLEMLTARARARFNGKYSTGESCWEWKAGKDNNGYGTFSLNGKGKSPQKAHRIAWLQKYGEFESGLEICHKCDNPSCVNPDHLFTGTHKENMIDAKRKGRLKIKSKGKSGELNNSSKLNKFQVEEIRQLITMGHSYTSISKLYPVTRHSISNIARNRKWKI